MCSAFSDIVDILINNPKAKSTTVALLCPTFLTAGLEVLLSSPDHHQTAVLLCGGQALLRCKFVVN